MSKRLTAGVTRQLRRELGEVMNQLEEARSAGLHAAAMQRCPPPPG